MRQDPPLEPGRPSGADPADADAVPAAVPSAPAGEATAQDPAAGGPEVLGGEPAHGPAATPEAPVRWAAPEAPAPSPWPDGETPQPDPAPGPEAVLERETTAPPSSLQPSQPGLPPEPERRLSASVLVVWMLSGAIFTAVVGIASAAMIPVFEAVEGMPGWVVTLLRAVVPLTGALAIVIVPVLRYRSWRFAVREDELDLVRGAIVRRRTIVPMARVQHVDTAQGLVGRMLDFASLNVHTAAATHEIPGIPMAEAFRLRTEIARRARVADEV